MKNKYRTSKDLIAITVGCALYALGLVTVNITNHLAEGGITGITLILRYWFKIDPAYSTIILNIPLIIVGYKFLGRRSLAYTLYGTLMLSVFLWIFQRIPNLALNLHHDLFIAALLGGLIGGLGCGIIYRFGGTTGGSDVVARILEKQRGIPMGRSLLVFDIFVLVASLSYLDISHMMYTLMASYVLTRIVNFIEDGAYAAKGLLIVSNRHQQIADALMAKLERGVSFLEVEGGYEHTHKKMIYCVVGSNEIADAKRTIQSIDEQAFISILNVHEAIGEGFSYKRPTKRKMLRN